MDKNIVSIGRFMKEKKLTEFPVCNVCGGQIVEAAVLCQNCDTPHHLDCWEYQGEKCAVYGCVPEKNEIVDEKHEAGIFNYIYSGLLITIDFITEPQLIIVCLLMYFVAGTMFSLLNCCLGIEEILDKKQPSQLEGPESKD